MFDRFTARAMQAIFHARVEVSLLGSDTLEPEHLLLGLLAQRAGAACRILEQSGGSLDQFRADVVARLPTGVQRAEATEVPFSHRSMRVLQNAVEEADRLSHEAAGTEHLLIALLREAGTLGADALAARGLRVESVREAIVVSAGEGQPEPPGPPPAPANTYQWPVIPFAPSRTVHILHSGMQAPQQPCINHAGHVFSAYGFTLEDVIVRAWEGNRWHIEMPDGLRDDARFDFLMMLPQEETTAACLALLRSAVEQHFAVAVAREPRMRDVFLLTSADRPGPMLKRYPDPQPGFGCALLPFSVFRRWSPDTPMFPLDPFAVHSVPFFLLVSWFEEILGGEVVDDAARDGIYGFELKQRVDTPEAFIQLLRDEAGLAIERQRCDRSTLVVRRRAPAT